LLPKATSSVVVLEIKKISAILQKLVDALILLQEKRSLLLQEKQNLLLQGKKNTLEDKAIIEKFLRLFHVYTQAVEQLYALLVKTECLVNHSTDNSVVEPLNKLASLDSSVMTLLDGCLKALNYNHNYFEQYYEYGLVAKLDSEDPLPQLLELTAQIRDLCS
jgi:hypothetical protein